MCKSFHKGNSVSYKIYFGRKYFDLSYRIQFTRGKRRKLAVYNEDVI